MRRYIIGLLFFCSCTGNLPMSDGRWNDLKSYLKRNGDIASETYSQMYQTQLVLSKTADILEKVDTNVRLLNEVLKKSQPNICPAPTMTQDPANSISTVPSVQ